MAGPDLYIPGDVVLTLYGVGVLTKCPSDDNKFYQIRLWRIPGKSVGSSSVAHLNQDAIVEKLPAAPGMLTNRLLGDEEVQQVMVHSYYASTKTFLVTPYDENSDKNNQDSSSLSPSSSPAQWIEVPVSQLQSTAPSSKFYPLLEELMRRGNQTAAATTSILADEKVTKVVKKGAALLERKTNEVVEATSGNKTKDTVDHFANQVTESLPGKEDISQVYEMLKDEELTILLQKGKQRLQELMNPDTVSKATRDALKKSGIVIALNDQDENDDHDSARTRSVASEMISKSRDSALSALEDLLAEADVDKQDLTSIRDQLEERFTDMFDSLQTAAKSDRLLANIFETISGKTSAWQEATGRLLQTKSGSLFLEGASRLQQRAKAILSNSAGLDSIKSSKFTKAFTEGDAATARLKSLELGDAMRKKLVKAIEIRSGSHGGLDGIIAGALNSVKGAESGEKVQDMLQNLQSNASQTTHDARETLISVLANRSKYQDVALMKIEKTLVNLDQTYFGEEQMTPQEIAALATGEGGTAALFEPIAKRASNEISKQLDQAEQSAASKDPAMQAALQHVRKIVSGELTLQGLMDEVVNILNDEKIVAAGESIVKTGEVALDAIEGISGNQIADDVMKVAEKAGITKESVMSQIEALNMNEILDTAGNAVTDEKARRELVSSATDTALDFVLRILPSMPVPPFDGVKDGLLYHLSNLSMEGFKVKKEDIVVEIAGMRATKKSAERVKKQEPVFLDLEAERAKEQQQQQRNANGGRQTSEEGDDLLDVSVPDMSAEVKATELLIVDVQGISAVLDDAVWSFEQTYMPYLKGSGKANVKFSDGSIRLQFELRKRQKLSDEEDDDHDKDGAIEWEPVLCLHDRKCSIEEVELQLQGEGRLTWIVNKLAVIFKGPLRDYVVKTIVNILSSKSGIILEKLNQNLAPYWGLIMRTTGLKLENLIELDDRDIVETQPDEDEGLVELVWKENLPLGMNLLLNDESGRLKVVDFPRGSQARAVCTDKGIDPIVFNGATIVAVNGTRYDMQDDLFEALKQPSRPKSILFELADPEDAARVKEFVEGTLPKKGKKKGRPKQSKSSEPVEPKFETREVNFVDDGDLGLEFGSAMDDFGLVVKGFVEGEGGTVLAAERSGEIKKGDILTHVNGKLVLGEDGEGKKRAFEILQAEGSNRPLRLAFTENYLFHKIFEKNNDGVTNLGGPEELLLFQEEKRIVLRDFENVSGTAEANGILIGDHLIFINGSPVGAGCKLVKDSESPGLNDIYRTFRDERHYPIALTFARPKQGATNRWKAMSGQQSFSIESAETQCVTAESFEQIGCVFESVNNSDIILTDLFAVPGSFQLAMKPYADSNGRLELSIESINGQFVPTYASKEIVLNAMKRGWASDGRVEVLFCSDKRKAWMKGLQ